MKVSEEENRQTMICYLMTLNYSEKKLKEKTYQELSAIYLNHNPPKELITQQSTPKEVEEAIDWLMKFNGVTDFGYVSQDGALLKVYDKFTTLKNYYLPQLSNDIEDSLENLSLINDWNNEPIMYRDDFKNIKQHIQAQANEIKELEEDKKEYLVSIKHYHSKLSKIEKAVEEWETTKTNDMCDMLLYSMRKIVQILKVENNE